MPIFSRTLANLPAVDEVESPGHPSGTVRVVHHDHVSRPASDGPARGIATGAVLSAPLWLGILFLIRALVNAL